MLDGAVSLKPIFGVRNPMWIQIRVDMKKYSVQSDRV